MLRLFEYPDTPASLSSLGADGMTARSSRHCPDFTRLLPPLCGDLSQHRAPHGPHSAAREIRQGGRRSPLPSLLLCSTTRTHLRRPCACSLGAVPSAHSRRVRSHRQALRCDRTTSALRETGSHLSCQSRRLLADRRGCPQQLERRATRARRQTTQNRRQGVCQPRIRTRSAASPSGLHARRATRGGRNRRPQAKAVCRPR